MLAVSCQSDATDEEQPGPGDPAVQARPYPWKKPANFPEPVYDFKNNPLTYEGIALGKALFYDGRLSRNGTISCGFCHQPTSAFAHTDHALSHGIDDRIGFRNPLGIQNVAWMQEFFWDGGIPDLDLLPLAPIQNPDEMDAKPEDILKAVQADGTYPGMFKAAFGSEQVTSERFLKALSQFMLTLVSGTSRYDKYIRKEGETLTEQELSGLTIFKARCATCHAGELFTDQSFRNNGLPVLAGVKTEDLGRYRVSARPEDKNKFRVPSLRNVAVTLPYMHDGRFQTLEQVLNHYATGVTDNPALDPSLKAGGRTGIPLSRQEQRDLIAFLQTLTDFEFIGNRRFQPD